LNPAFKVRQDYPEQAQHVGVLQFDLLAADLDAPPPLPAPRPDGAEPPILTEAESRQRERENMRAALVKSGWRIHGENGAAELLGLKPTTLISRMKKIGLKRPAAAEQRT
jgi:transcriptional regulator with GAF, ATPase, and Fis domain